MKHCKQIIALLLCLALCTAFASCGSRPAEPAADTAVDTTAEMLSSVPDTVSEASESTIPAESTQPESTQTAAEQPTDTSASLTFADLPSEFCFSSGVGGWSTILKVNPDGTFDGEYHDSDFGTLYYSTFNGKFAQPEPLNAHAYTVKIQSFNVTNDPNVFDWEEDVEYVPSDPYGMENAKEMILYLPGTSFSDIPQECMDWLNWYQDHTALPDNVYVLFNAADGDAFIGEK